jgi:hypothetical protein
MALLLLNKIEYVFNKISLNLIKEIKEKDIDLKKILKRHYAVYDTRSDIHIKYFIEQLKARDISNEFIQAYEDDILGFDNVKQLNILKDISVVQIVPIINDQEHDVLKCYLYILYLLTRIYEDVLCYVDEDRDPSDIADEKITALNYLFNKCMKQINAHEYVVDLGEEVDDIIDDDLKILIENIFKSRSHVKESIMKYDNGELDGDENTNSFDEALDFLHNSKIGELAKEISSEIDLNNININKPDDIFNVDAMFSGNNNAFGDIIKNVGSKIAGKIQNGDIKQDELMQEAFTMMSKINGTNSFMNDMFENVANDQHKFKDVFPDTMPAAAGSHARKSKKQNQLRKRLEERNRNKE